MKFSASTVTLWAKKSHENSLEWLPLLGHMSDSANVSDYIWNHWLSDQSKCTIAASLLHEKRVPIIDEETSSKCQNFLRFLGAAHDIGKATPVFQLKNSSFIPTELDEVLYNNLIDVGLFESGIQLSDFSHAKKVLHAIATQALLAEYGVNRSTVAILGAHHGKPTSRDAYSKVRPHIYPKCFIMKIKDHVYEEIWQQTQKELIDFAMYLGKYTCTEEIPAPDLRGQVILTGLTIMIDWIASNEKYFPYLTLDDDCPVVFNENSAQRANKAMKLFDATRPWMPQDDAQYEDIYDQRFGSGNKEFVPHPMQEKVWEIANQIQDPGIMIIEAPMGQGKTEAALVAAEIFAEKKGASGIYFALPTQATTDGIFPRIREWIKNLDDEDVHSIVLAHGKAQFNDEYSSLFEGSTNVDKYDNGTELIVHTWFEGKKKSLLADFIVGTIDQLLMMALKQKHVMLRHVGLAEKIVIIDECHAYDAYMNKYLERTLSWLGAYGIPVILLSATLPIATRQNLVNAYLNKDEFSKHSEQIWETSRDYPLMTYSDGKDVANAHSANVGRQIKVKVLNIKEGEVIQKLRDKLADGGCVGIILNTVKRVQQFSRLLEKEFGSDAVCTIHSQFIVTDRFAKEKELRRELGPQSTENSTRPKLRIVVGTQVLEQSLNIDFDLMITDLSPMDLILQRLGRLHRFSETQRFLNLEQPECWILRPDEDLEAFDSGSENIYGRYLLQRTQGFLKDEITIPEDIPDLVQDVYDDKIILSIEPEDYSQSREEHFKKIEKQISKAGAYRIGQPQFSTRANILGWLDTYLSDAAGEAAVRDTDPSFEVIVLFKTEDEDKYFFHDKNGVFHSINRHQSQSKALAQALAQHRISMPRALCKPWNIDETIQTLEILNKRLFGKILESVWLNGELILPLDIENPISFAGYSLMYSKKEGLLYDKEGGDNEWEKQ